MEQEQGSFEDVRSRLEEIVDEVNAEDIPLDDALKLYEEAVKLGLSACELSEKDIFPQEEAAEEAEVAEGEAVPEDEDGVAVSTETFEAPYEASDIAEAAAIEHMGDAASVQFEESAEVADDGQATYPR